MRCQNVDGGRWDFDVMFAHLRINVVSMIEPGREPLGDFAFRAVLPDLKCQDPAPLVTRLRLRLEQVEPSSRILRVLDSPAAS